MLGLAIVLVLAGVAISLWDILKPEEEIPPGTVLKAKRNIDTYTVLTSDMVEPTQVPAERAEGAYGKLDEKTALITTRPIKEGEIIDHDVAVEVGGSWRPGTMELEIISFPAEFDKMVAGQLKPGHKINVYGYYVGEEVEELASVKLIADNVWAVDARTTSGTEAEARPPEPGEGGPLGLGGLAEARAAPASIVTVAVEPEVALKIIEALGAQKYRAWVTLSGPPLPTPTPTPVPPEPTSTPTPTPPLTPEPTPIPITEGMVPLLEPGEWARASYIGDAKYVGRPMASGEPYEAPIVGLGPVLLKRARTILAQRGHPQDWGFEVAVMNAKGDKTVRGKVMDTGSEDLGVNLSDALFKELFVDMARGIYPAKVFLVLP